MDAELFKSFLTNVTFKPFHPFLKLAASCITTQPCISYWAVYYCCDHGMRINPQTPEIKSFVETMMLCLEKAKQAQKEQFGDDDQQKDIVEKYGSQLFLRAEDEAELEASPTTAIKIYLSSANVFQLLEYFLKDDQSKADNAKRIKYCKYKAVMIAKKAKEQPPRAPSPAPSASDGEEDPSGSNLDSQIPPPPGLDDNIFNYPQGPQGNSSPYPNFPPASSSGGNNNFTPTPSPRQSVGPVQPTSSGYSDAPFEPSPIPVENFSSMSLKESDVRKAELLCESALYAIKSNDLYNAVTGLQQSLQHIYKAARANRK